MRSAATTHIMPRLSLLLLAASTAVDAGWAHGWRDQYVRVSAKLRAAVTSPKWRRHLAQMDATEEEGLAAAAKAAVMHAERIFHAKRHDEQRARDPHRRHLMSATCNGTTCTIQSSISGMET